MGEVALIWYPPPGKPIHPLIEVRLLGTTLVGPKKSKYSTPGTISQVTVALDSSAVATRLVGGGADDPAPHPNKTKDASTATTNNLNERKIINGSG
jgi:hypothetical protein